MSGIKFGRWAIIHGLMYFPPDIVTPSTTVTRNPRSLLLQEPHNLGNEFQLDVDRG